MYSQYSQEMENVLFLHLTIVRQSWLWRAGYAPTDVQVINSIFQNMHQIDGGAKPGLTIDHNHFVEPATTMGTAQTTGAAGFCNAASHDYRLLPVSPARGTGCTLQCVPADIDGVPHPSDGRNRGCCADAPVGAALRVRQDMPASLGKL